MAAASAPDSILSGKQTPDRSLVQTGDRRRRAPVSAGSSVGSMSKLLSKQYSAPVYAASAQGDILGGDIAGQTAVAHHIPALQRPKNGDGFAVGDGSQHPGGKGRRGPQIQRAVAHGHPGLLRRLGLGQRQAEVLGNGKGNGPGDLGDAALDPGLILGVVMIGKLQKDRRRFGLRHLAQRRGGQDAHLFRQGIDLLEIFAEDLGGPAAVCAVAVVINIRAPLASGLTLRGGVAVDGDIQAVIPGVGLADGVSGGAVGVVAGIVDAAGKKIGDHLVADQVHILFLRSAAEIGVPILGGRAEKNTGHGAPPYSGFLHSMRKRREGVPQGKEKDPDLPLWKEVRSGSCFSGAGDRARTGMILLSRDFKSLASADFATPAYIYASEKQSTCIF